MSQNVLIPWGENVLIRPNCTPGAKCANTPILYYILLICKVYLYKENIDRIDALTINMNNDWEPSNLTEYQLDCLQEWGNRKKN